MKKIFVAGVANIVAVAVLVLATATPAVAQTEVATIGGCYDCLGNWDTPVLFINNSTGGTLGNATLQLYGYQADNLGKTSTVNLGNLGAGTTNFAWGSLPGGSTSTIPHDLTAYDYDDEFANTTLSIPTTNCGYTQGCVSGGGPYWYAQTGNFQVTFTAQVVGGTYNGDLVYAQFSPSNNATGGFVGWEGLDALGFSESPYDVHAGVVTGDLANIYLGTPPPFNPAAVPEPETYAMLLAGLSLLGFMARRRKQKEAA